MFMRVKSRALTSLAKITQPSAHRSYPRENLFAVLDRYSDRRLIWVSAPAGYGKTTAVSSYLQRRGKPAIWYQCDEGDADVASCFLHLIFAREKFTGDAWEQAEALAPEHLAEIPTFTRNFFRAWFSGLPSGTVLVLDNFHELPAGAPLRSVLPIIAEQIPEDAWVVVISREDPGDESVRLLANQLLGVIGVEDLQLSRAETRAIVNMQAQTETSKASISDAELYDLTQGWAAGVTLLVRRGRGAGMALPSGISASRQTLFNYFAIEVFDRLDLRIRELLLRTALLEQITVPMAQHLAGDPDAGAVLDELVRQNAFTTFRPGPDSYHYHPLFRDFLRMRLDASMPAEEQRALMIRAAHALLESKDPEAAIALLLRASEWREAASLIIEIAPTMVQEVRFTGLARWLDALPANLLEESGWLSYWRGIQQMVTEFPLACRSLEHAFERFAAARDTIGQMLACAGVIQHITYCYGDYETLVPWLNRLQALLTDAKEFPTPSLELQVTSGFLMALAVSNPQHAALRPTVTRVQQLLAGDVDVASCAAAISALQHLFGGIGRTEEYGDLDERITRLLAQPKLGPAARIHIMWAQAWQLHLGGETRQVLEILSAARAIAAHHHLVEHDLQLQMAELQASDSDIRSSKTAITFANLEPRMRSMPPILASQFLYVRALCEHRAGNAAAALHYIQQSLQSMPRNRWPLAGCLLWQGAAEIHCEAQRYAEALSCLSVCEELVAGVRAPLIRFNVQLVRAEIARRTGDHAGFETALREAFAIGKLQGFAHSYHAGSLLLPRLIPHALRMNTEVPYCCWVIEKRDLKPPDEDAPRWPWKIRVRAMGRLEIEVDGALLPSTGKTQGKPLQLLKALLVGSEGSRVEQLMDLLWPELEGDAARNALDLAIHRLRKLLGHRDAVLTSQGRIMLNRALVWVDAYVLERTNFDGSTPDVGARADRLLELYRGPLLPEEELPMVNLARVRLEAKFGALVRGLRAERGLPSSA
jgi:ATP/maltotriose-dependent transcriptional regulator MalT